MVTSSHAEGLKVRMDGVVGESKLGEYVKA